MDIGGLTGDFNRKMTDYSARKALDGNFESHLKKAVENKDTKELKKACRQFEAIFIQMMYKQMKATVPKSDLLSKDSARETFEQLFDEKLSEEAAGGKGTGIADMLYKQLVKQVDRGDSKADEAKRK